MQNLAQMLSKDEIFKSLPSKEIESLVNQSINRKLMRGEYLCHQGEEWPYSVYVSRGQLRWAILSVSGREQVLFKVAHGHSFWGHSLFDDRPMPGSLNAITPSNVFIWSRSTLLPILNRNPIVLWALLRRQTDIMRRAREVIYGLAFSPVAGRLARLLLDETTGQEGQVVQRGMTLNEIAATISTSQEVVCRMLYQFHADNLIELNRANYFVKDRSALEKMIEKS